MAQKLSKIVPNYMKWKNKSISDTSDLFVFAHFDCVQISASANCRSQSKHFWYFLSNLHSHSVPRPPDASCEPQKTFEECVNFSEAVASVA